ncbi:MAG: anti-sigma factor domain-containing protein [Acidimicrobiia bacterium]
MRCEEARAAMLSGADIEPVRQHLATCQVCRSEQPMWAKMSSTLSSHSLWEEPPSDLSDRILQTVRGLDERDYSDTRAQPEHQRTALFAGVAVTLLIALAGTFFATRSLTADWEMTLATSEELPGATAVIRGWSTAMGTRMVLDITGVEDAPSGSYYEIWMTAPDGRHISAGTFSGSGRVTAFAGVRRADYPRIWITLETADDDLGPSPETYFDTA